MDSKKIDITNEDLNFILFQVKAVVENEVIINFKKFPEFAKNSLNLKIIQKAAEEKNKDVRFRSEKAEFKEYLDAVNGDTVEFNDDELNLEGDSGRKFKLPFALPALFGFLRGKSGIAGSSSTNRKILGLRLAKIVFIPLLILSAVAGIFFALLWYVPTAEANITVDTKGLIKLFDVTASTDFENVSVEDTAIPAFSVSVTETDSQTIPTTGKKEVGDEAEGEITITNKTDKDVKLDKGTILKLISSDEESLRYETTENATISKSEENEAEDGVVYGKEKVEIRALNYGEGYNIGNGKNFEVSDYDTDELVGENENNIEGGSVEEINTVNQADLDSLKKSLQEFMEKKVEESLRRKIVSGQELQTSSIQFEVSAADFDKQLDEEGDELTLTMVVEGRGLAYDDSALDELMNQLVSTVVPDSFDLSDENIEYEVAATLGDNPEDLKLQVKLKSFIAPKLNADKIKSDLSGMTLDEAQAYLDALNDVSSFEVIMSPQLPAILMRIPMREENIKINIGQQNGENSGN